ncbi:phosphoribosylanthranilate isomerase [candidate division KSB1 bacterium]|nr:phosphoribosylanthranilate isomerase [candidate division KSB1 bacterium]
MFIKICGITNIEDALFAANLGASALGFIFAPSKRQIAPKVAAEIISQIPKDIENVGVFVNETHDNILKIGDQIGLSCIQLHGNESPQLCFEIGKQFKTIKAIKIDPSGKVKETPDYPVWKILLDTYVPNAEGGSGKTFNWKPLKAFDLANVIIAGGLKPENIKDLLSQFSPFGVDLSSGVEAFPGKKDFGKLQRFFQQIKLVT